MNLLDTVVSNLKSTFLVWNTQSVKMVSCASNETFPPTVVSDSAGSTHRIVMLLDSTVQRLKHGKKGFCLQLSPGRKSFKEPKSCDQHYGCPSHRAFETFRSATIAHPQLSIFLFLQRECLGRFLFASLSSFSTRSFY
jgi:hypothetical protein